MKKNIKCCIAIIIICVMTLQLISCATDHNNNEETLVQTTVIAIEKYGHAVLDVNLMEMLRYVTGESTDKLGQIDLENAVTSYLIKAGMTQEDIFTLKEKLS